MHNVYSFFLQYIYTLLIIKEASMDFLSLTLIGILVLVFALALANVFHYLRDISAKLDDISSTLNAMKDHIE